MKNLFQIAGALLVLVAFVLAQAGRLRPDSRPYLVLNFVGGSILAIDAAIGREPGFLMMEVVWAAVAGYGLLRTYRKSP